jgi:hypothetical protein
MKLVHNVARETLEYFQTAFLHTGKIVELQGMLDVLEDQIEDIPEGATRRAKREKYRNLLTLKYQHMADYVDLVFLCYEALQMLQAETTRAASAKEGAECRRKTDALTYLFGELFRLLLVPEYIDVRNTLMTTIHDVFLEYQAEGIPGALISFLKKVEVLLFRLDMYGRDANEEKETIIGGSRYRHLYFIAGIMERVSGLHSLGVLILRLIKARPGKRQGQ